MKLLILDLDETLIHATECPLSYPLDFIVGPYFVYKRPYVDEFIAFCQTHFAVAVWTSSTKLYASKVVSHLFPENYPLQFVFARDKCVRRFDPELHEEYYIKDLRKAKAKGFALEETIVLDDTPQKLSRNYGNLVCIRQWCGDREDRELLYVQQYLLVLKNHPNIRQIEKRFWRKEIGCQ